MDNGNIFVFSKNTMLCNLWNCETHKWKRKYYKTLVKKYKIVRNQHNTYTPYAIANMIMANYTTSYDKKIMHICIKCHSNLNKLQNVTYVVYQPPSYMATLLSTHTLHVQLLSFLHI